MSSRRATFYVTLGQLCCITLVFFRSVIVARCIGPREFGIASIFLLLAGFVEMSTGLAAEKILIQARDGNRPSLQASIHFVQIMRGAWGAAAIMLAARPLAVWLEVPEATTGFLLLSLYPFLNGFRHTDTARAAREMRLGPEVATDVTSQLAAFAAACVSAPLLRTNACVLVALLVQAAAAVSTSHIVARRRFRVSFSKTYVRRVLRFGLPLMASGVVMFCIAQGDRLVVAKIKGTSMLGIYAVAASSAMMGATLIARIVGSVGLPHLARVGTDRAQLSLSIRTMMWRLTLATGIFTGVFILAGPTLLPLAYGVKYQQSSSIIDMLALAQALWVLRTAPSIAGIALADGSVVLSGNVVRLLSLALTTTYALRGGSLRGIAITLAIGEVMAYAITILWLKLRTGIGVAIWVPAPLLLLLAVCLWFAVRLTAHQLWISFR